MELIRISDGKLKISLTEEELCLYGIGRGEGTETASDGFRELLISECGEESKVFLQIFRAKGGGCEIFVCRLGSERKKQERGVMAVFTSLDGMLCACRELKRIDEEVLSSAYRYGKEYRLILKNASETVEAFLGELGRVMKIPPFEVLGEHYEPIRLGDAVSVLGGL